MQRDRARERMERAKRQWELEHASDTCIDGEKFNTSNNSIFTFGFLFIYRTIMFHFKYLSL